MMERELEEGTKNKRMLLYMGGNILYMEMITDNPVLGLQHY